ncbi:hypothetical protein [Cohnella yongneupensis]|uniref:Uncharacterized protein n=1 Tax=Cohnella yongneupensis TaxID=425006 RepID=A0ABW0R6Z0_9BACL
MNKKNSTTIALSAAVLALMLVATACSNNDGNAKPTPSATPSVTASAAPDESAASPEPSVEASAEPSEAPEVKSVTGEYVGLIDGHSIEIKTADGSTAFQISPEISDKVDPWAEGTSVKFEYTEDTLDVNGEQVTQYTIQSIDKQ